MRVFTPREKAEELIESYRELHWEFNINEMNRRNKQCALIAVDYIVRVILNKQFGSTGGMFWRLQDQEDYWDEVKEEIEKL